MRPPSATPILSRCDLFEHPHGIVRQNFVGGIALEPADPLSEKPGVRDLSAGRLPHITADVEHEDLIGEPDLVEMENIQLILNRPPLLLRKVAEKVRVRSQIAGYCEDDPPIKRLCKLGGNKCVLKPGRPAEGDDRWSRGIDSHTRTLPPEW